MFSVEQYLEMARDCMASAETEIDPKRRKALLDMAKLYMQSAVGTGAAVRPSDLPPPANPQGT
jgi:hypothetical protein